MFQTEFEFTLPCGYIDERGTLHRQGSMRRATARDELQAMSHPQARANEVYLTVLLLSRVIVRLGSLVQLGPEEVEGLFASDFAHLQDMYLRVNGGPANMVQTRCPACGTRIVVDMNGDEHDA
jgi:hypothetical protein